MLSFRQRLVLPATIAAFGLLLSGCGPKHPETFPVTGTVTLDGQPVAGAAVVFTPESGEQATATTDGSGQFELSTFELRDGAVPGKHRVTVAKTEVEPGEEEQVVFVVPREYGNATTSPLTCEVQPEMAPVQLDLKSGPKAASPPATEEKSSAPEAKEAAETPAEPAKEPAASEMSKPLNDIGAAGMGTPAAAAPAAPAP
ncbi:MAG: carboxypeptidase-like regulatory domain-containing protein [Thermoguttaceae bacterium]